MMSPKEREKLKNKTFLIDLVELSVTQPESILDWIMSRNLGNYANMYEYKVFRIFPSFRWKFLGNFRNAIDNCLGSVLSFSSGRIWILYIMVSNVKNQAWKHLYIEYYEISFWFMKWEERFFCFYGGCT